MQQFFLSWGLIIIAAFLDSYAALVIKLRFNELGRLNLTSLRMVIAYLLHLAQSPLLLTAIIAFILAPIFWFFALNRVEVSVGYPVLVAFHLVFIAIFALIFLGESISLVKIIAFALILISLYLLKQK